jgi:hypothetical protein
MQEPVGHAAQQDNCDRGVAASAGHYQVSAGAIGNVDDRGCGSAQDALDDLDVGLDASLGELLRLLFDFSTSFACSFSPNSAATGIASLLHRIHPEPKRLC